MSHSDAAFIPQSEVVDAFKSAAITTLQELTQVEAFVHQARSNPADELLENVVSANMHLMRQIPGSMSLVLTEETASRLAARYLPEGTELNEEMIEDVAGEFANVIAGQAKTILKGTPYHFTLSTPVVVRAANSAQLPGVANSSIVAWLESEIGPILVLVNLRPCPGA